MSALWRSTWPLAVLWPIQLVRVDGGEAFHRIGGLRGRCGRRRGAAAVRQPARALPAASGRRRRLGERDGGGQRRQRARKHAEGDLHAEFLGRRQRRENMGTNIMARYGNRRWQHDGSPVAMRGSAHERIALRSNTPGRIERVSVASNETGNLWENPLGTDGFEFVEYAAPDPQAMGRAVRADGLHRRRAASLEERAALPAGQRQFHRQRGAELVRAVVRARARPEHLRDRVSREGRGDGVRAMRSQRRVGRRGASRSDGAQHPGDQGHRRFADLPRRPLSGSRRRRRLDLRHRLRAAARHRRSIRRARASPTSIT